MRREATITRQGYYGSSFTAPNEMRNASRWYKAAIGLRPSTINLALIKSIAAWPSSLPLRLLTRSHGWLATRSEVAAGIAADSRQKVIRNWRGHDDVMQTRSFRGSGEPARVSASSNACFRLGPDPRRALGPAAIRAASTGRTHDRTRPMLHQRQKALVNQAPSTHDP